MVKMKQICSIEPWMAPYIEERWEVFGQASGSLILPDNCMDLIYADQRCWVIGPATKAFYATLSSQETIIGLRFKPGILPILLGCGAHELKDQRINLELLAPCSAKERRARLETARQDGSLRLLEGLASARARTVSELARELGWSERQLQRKLIPLLGYPAKPWLRINRLRQLRAHLAQLELPELALSAGFYDQPHMNRECKKLTGLSPLELKAQLCG